MFNDPLTREQCERLLVELSQTSFPFQCAHGRYVFGICAALCSELSKRVLDWQTDSCTHDIDEQ